MQFGSLYVLQTLRQTSERMLDTAFIGYGVQRGLYTIVGKNSYTLIRLTKHAFTILYTILGKTSYLPSLGEQAFAFYVLLFLCVQDLILRKKFNFRNSNTILYAFCIHVYFPFVDSLLTYIFSPFVCTLPSAIINPQAN